MSTAGRETAAEDHGRSELERLRAELRDLRARARVYPLISQAQGILQERYALPDAESAFALLQRASQQHNVKVRTLAGALIRTPRPDDREPLWFPRRVRLPEPALTFTTAHRSGSGSRGAVLKAVLGTTLTVTSTDMGNVQLSDPARGGLRIEQHTGLTADFVDFFAFVGEDGTSCAQAARDVSQVTIREVESDPALAEPARTAIRAGRPGRLAGHHPRGGERPRPRRTRPDGHPRGGQQGLPQRPADDGLGAVRGGGLGPHGPAPARTDRDPDQGPRRRGHPGRPLARLARPHGGPRRPGAPARPRPGPQGIAAPAPLSGNRGRANGTAGRPYRGRAPRVRHLRRVLVFLHHPRPCGEGLVHAEHTGEGRQRGVTTVP